VASRRPFPSLALLRGTSGFGAVVQTGVATVLMLAVNVVTGIISARAFGAQGRGELSALLQNRLGAVALFHLAGLTLAAVLVYLGALRFGAEGAAGGLLAATSLRFILTYSGFGCLLGMRTPPLLPARTELLTLLSLVRARVA
jgi:hypothetical protein